MKKVISLLSVLLLIVLISPLNQSIAKTNPNSLKSKKSTVTKKAAMMNLKASNSTSDGVYVGLTGPGGPYSFFIPPHTPSGTVIGQILQTGDPYTLSLNSTGGAHDMWVYWEHRTHVTGFTVSGMSIGGCESCAVITIFN